LQKEDNVRVKKFMKWRVPGQEADQRRLVERDCGKRLSRV